MSRFAYVAPCLAVLLAPTACSGGGAPQTPQTPSVAKSVAGAAGEALSSTANGTFVPQATLADNGATSTAKIFVSDGAANAVFIYNAAGKKIGRIAGDSGFLATDAARSLYVVHSSPTAAVDVYAKPYSGRPFKIVPPEYPVGVAIAPGNRLLAVTDVISQSGGPGSVDFYRHGETKPCATVTLPGGRAYFDAFDAAGDLFLDASDTSGNTVVYEIVGGCKATAPQRLSTGNVILFPGGVSVDKRDRIVIDDQSGEAIYTYAHPKGTSLGQPVLTTPLSAGDPLTFVLANDAHDVWVVDVSLAEVNEYTFPSGGSPTASLDVGGQPNGVAVVPAVLP